MNHLRHQGSMRAALGLIQSCLHNKEYDDALFYAREAYFMINDMTDNFIPSAQQPQFLSDVSYYLAQAILSTAMNSNISPEEKQKIGVEAIEHARKALELSIQLHGTEKAEVARNMGSVAEILDYFNNVDDDEVPRLLEQSIAIFRRVEGNSSSNVGECEKNLGNVYQNRVKRGQIARDLTRCTTNSELALPHLREAARIYRVNNQLGMTEAALRSIAQLEEFIRQGRIHQAAGATNGRVSC